MAPITEHLSLKPGIILSQYRESTQPLGIKGILQFLHILIGKSVSNAVIFNENPRKEGRVELEWNFKNIFV